MYEGGLEEMRLDKWDWVWLIIYMFMMVLYSYFGIVGQNASLWNKILNQVLVGLAGINFGFILGMGRMK